MIKLYQHIKEILSFFLTIVATMTVMIIVMTAFLAFATAYADTKSQQNDTKSITVFSLGTQTIQGITPAMFYCEIDKAQQITNALNELSEKLAAEGKSISDRNQALQEKVMASQKALDEASGCLAKALNAGVTKVPAVLIEDKNTQQDILVYGAYDVGTALRLASAYEEQPR